MTIALTGTGGFFTRLGVWGGGLRNAYGYLAATDPSPGSAWGASGPTIKSLGTNVANVFAQYATTHQEIVKGLTDLQGSLQSGGFGSLWSATSAAALATLLGMADDDVTLTSFDKAVALAELIRQMNNSSDSVKKPTVSITPANGSPAPTGNPVLAGSVIGPDGVQLDYLYNEVVDVTCTQDSYTGGATAGQETLTCAGDAKVDYQAYNWPKGSGCTPTLPAVDDTSTASNANNLLTNSNFDTFTVANTPDGYTLVAGTPGTQIFSEATDTYPASTGKSLKLAGSGGVQTQLYQTITSLLPSAVYALNVFLHVDAAAPAAGTLVFELLDNTGTIINDDAGTANRYTVDLTQATLQTTYKATGAMTTTELNGASVSGGSGAIFFRMPKTWVPGATARVQIRMGTAITNAKNVFLDRMSLQRATQLYGSGIAGGPFVAAFSGSTKLVSGDRFKFTVSNGYQSQWQNLLWRWFDLPSVQQRFPSASGNTINENLIA